MRKHYILPVLLILGLGAVGAVAQNITKALQLSQDAAGDFGVDSNNNVYFPGHILNTGRGQGAVTTVAGTGTPTLVGTDVGGTVTMGAAATTATVTFGRAYVTAPGCVVTWNTGALGLSPISWVTTTTSIALSQPARSGNTVTYFCTSAS